MNGIMLFRHKSTYQNIPKKQQEFDIKSSFGFFLKDEEVMSRTINYSNIDLDKFPASKVRQLPKKLESSKSTAKHIKQMSSEPQAKQVILLRHQCRTLPPSKFQRKQRKSFKSRQANYKYQQEDKQHKRLPQVNRRFNQEDRCSKCGDTSYIEGFKCLASRHQCKYCQRFGHSSNLCFKKMHESAYKRSSRNPKEHQLMVGKYSTEGPLYDQADTSLTLREDSFCLQMQLKSMQA